jgi:hypothetical protein
VVQSKQNTRGRRKGRSRCSFGREWNREEYVQCTCDPAFCCRVVGTGLTVIVDSIISAGAGHSVIVCVAGAGLAMIVVCLGETTRLTWAAVQVVVKVGRAGVACEGEKSRLFARLEAVWRAKCGIDAGDAAILSE